MMSALVLHNSLAELRELMQFDGIEQELNRLPQVYSHTITFGAPSTSQQLPEEVELIFAFSFQYADPVKSMHAFYNYLSILLRCE